MSGKGRGLTIAAVVVGLAGMLLGVGDVAYARAAYGASVVRSESMSPTYRPGDSIVYERIDGSQVRRGDVVLVSAPQQYGVDGLVVKRVIGLGGDRVACCAGKEPGASVSVNGAVLREPYAHGGGIDGGLTERPYDVRVPEGRMFLLGDDRANSVDSRSFLGDQGGTLALSAVRGRVVDDYTGPVLLGTALIVAVVLVLAGVGLGIAAAVVRRRARAWVAPAPPWIVQG